MNTSYGKALLGSFGAALIMLCVTMSSWSMSQSHRYDHDPERMTVVLPADGFTGALELSLQLLCR
jgi:hypothetical protein